MPKLDSEAFYTDPVAGDFGLTASISPVPAEILIVPVGDARPAKRDPGFRAEEQKAV